MRKFGTIHRIYRMQEGDYVSVSEPSTIKQRDGFKPTFISPEKMVSLGDNVETNELNFIIGTLYDMADAADEQLKRAGG